MLVAAAEVFGRSCRWACSVPLVAVSALQQAAAELFATFALDTIRDLGERLTCQVHQFLNLSSRHL